MNLISDVLQIFFYSSGIYANAGVPMFAIQYAVLITNAVNVIMTIVAVCKTEFSYFKRVSCLWNA
jgi:hypothetical protein